MKKKINCPTHESNYYILNDHCIFVEKSSKTYENSKQNCKTKFGGNGKLFEPMTWSENIEAYKIAKDTVTSSKYFWIGVNDKETEGSYVYETTGKPILFTPKFYSSSYGSRGTSYNCILYNPPSSWYDSDVVHWQDYSCTSSYYSICESSDSVSRDARGSDYTHHITTAADPTRLLDNAASLVSKEGKNSKSVLKVNFPYLVTV